MTVPDPSTELMRLINGYQVSQALHVAAKLRVADQLKDGPRSYDALAEACGAQPDRYIDCCVHWLRSVYFMRHPTKNSRSLH